jgi:hypothetical protein
MSSFSWNIKKNPFRKFDKDVVITNMNALNMIPEQFSGVRRKLYPAKVMDFETFDSLSDPVEYFAEAMNTELEHGIAGDALHTNVTNDVPLATAMIVAAHLNGVEFEKTKFTTFPTYYDFLWWMEGIHEAAVERFLK